MSPCRGETLGTLLYGVHSKHDSFSRSPGRRSCFSGLSFNVHNRTRVSNVYLSVVLIPYTGTVQQWAPDLRAFGTQERSNRYAPPYAKSHMFTPMQVKSTR